MEKRSTIFLIVLLLLRGLTPAAEPTRLQHAPPASVGMSTEHLDAIDRVVAEGLNRGRMPGAVVLVGRRDRVVYLKAFGHRQVAPEPRAMTTDTVFDMASITKPVATASSVMKLVEEGRVQLRDPIAKYIPEFGQNGKQDITVYHLLTHQGGLIPDNALSDYDDGPQKAFERIHALEPIAAPGEKFAYTDVGFIMLAELVEKVSGKNVHIFSQAKIFKPLGMTETGYLPAAELRSRAATTQERDGHWMQGEVHDPRAYRLGGIAGHAGLFSTAEDLAVYAQMMIGSGTYRGVRVFDPETVALMTKAREVPRGRRALGWDKLSPYSSNRGDLLSGSAFGHGGFTGTVLWIDPELELFVVFLSNRVHPDGKGSVNLLAGRIVTLAAAAIQSAPAVHPPTVHEPRPDILTGIDVLERDGFKQLAGRKVGLITNHTGIDRKNVSTVQLLHGADNVDLVALFSPEHGFEGKLDVARIGNAKDQGTGLKIYSLYGETRTPTDEMLQGLDTLVFDIQDIGTRYYTYMSTMGNAMRAAAKHKLRFVVLDRPNPINGTDVAGPVLDPGSESFVGFHPIPVRHGMTAGELARMFNEELKLGLHLDVIKVEGWRREDMYDRTGLLWINPSPNMRSLTEAVLYPGIGLLETTNLSVGRGTDTPFEVLGAPWLDGVTLAKILNARGLRGVRFVPIRFTPESSKFKDTECGGVNIIVTDRGFFRPVRTGLEIARQLRLLYSDDWDAARFNRLLSNTRAYEAVLAGKTVDEIEINTRPEFQAFLKRREKYLLYQ